MFCCLLWLLSEHPKPHAGFIETCFARHFSENVHNENIYNVDSPTPSLKINK